MTLNEFVKKVKELEEEYGADTNIEFVIKSDLWSSNAEDSHAQSIGGTKEFHCTHTSKKYINIFLR